MNTSDTMDCPLCGGSAQPYHQDRRRSYYHCARCSLVSVPRRDFPTPQEARAVYELHENGPEDAGYRTFLSRLCAPMIARLPAGSEGLDFGCGPGPTLSVMFQEQGYPMAIYDPCFAPDRTALSRQYTFVTGSEVVEHFEDPRASLDEMWALVKPGGFLGLMTKLVIDQAAFQHWHYKDDETHLVFYSRQTFTWLGRDWGSEPTFLGKDVIIFQKHPSAKGIPRLPIFRGR